VSSVGFILYYNMKFHVSPLKYRKQKPQQQNRHILSKFQMSRRRKSIWSQETRRRKGI